MMIPTSAMSPTIHVLLVEDNRLEARQTHHWLSTRKDVAVEVESVERLSAAIERLTRGGIDAVLLDLNLPDSRGLETFTKLHQNSPGVPVIVLTGEHDESMGIVAVQQGAADYLVKRHVDGDMLFKTVQFAVARHGAQAEQIKRVLRGTPGRVLSFLGVKGGVGTTTVAINVAVALATQGKSVIVAELKPALGGLTFSLQGEPMTGLASLLDLPGARIRDHDLSAALSPGPATTRILFGSHEGACDRQLDAEQTEAIVKGLARLADYVILDLPCWPSVTTSTAAPLSEYVAVVTEREPLAVRCGQVVVNQLKGSHINDALIGAIVVGRSILPLSMDLPAIRSLMGCGILRMVPPATAACYKAYVDRVPLVLSQPNDDAAEVYLDIARSLADERVCKIATI